MRNVEHFKNIVGRGMAGRMKVIPATQAAWALIARVPEEEILRRKSHRVTYAISNYVGKIDQLIDEGEHGQKVNALQALFHPNTIAARKVYAAIEHVDSEASKKELAEIFQAHRDIMLHTAIRAPKTRDVDALRAYREGTSGALARVHVNMLNAIHGVKNSEEVEKRFAHFGMAAQLLDDISDVKEDIAIENHNMFLSLLEGNEKEKKAVYSAKKITPPLLKRIAPKTFKKFSQEFQKEYDAATQGAGKPIKPLLALGRLGIMQVGVKHSFGFGK